MAVPKEVPVTAVRKALELLSILLFETPRREGLPLKELAGRLGIPVNTAHNLLKTMRLSGYVSRAPGGRYRAGPACLRIAMDNFADGSRLLPQLDSVLGKYLEIIRESLVFTTLVGGMRNVVARCVHDGEAIQVNLHAIDGADIYRVATGRALIALADETEYREILEANGDIDDFWPEYESDIPRLRRQGFFDRVLDGNGVREFAVAFRSPDGGTLCALGCYAPKFRCGDDRAGRLVDQLRLAAGELRSTLWKAAEI